MNASYLMMAVLFQLWANSAKERSEKETDSTQKGLMTALYVIHEIAVFLSLVAGCLNTN